MSAITGIFYRDGRKVDLKLIKKMNNRLSHRGPDGSKVWFEGSIALGQQMLETTPESLHEKLPYYNSKSGLVITADARIDNRKELSVELDIEDKVDVSDSYFILKAYEKWGEKCPEYLLGDFAFAIWDENQEKLFCARDHMGVKQLYYYLDQDIFVFATEIKALFSIPDVPRTVNEKRIAFFLMTITDCKFTFYENIFSFEPANSISIEKNIHTKREYWKLNAELEITLDSEEEYVDRYRDLFQEAVHCRLRSAYPIGFQLSGGLDSSSVLCMAKEICNNKTFEKEINSFSIVFNDLPCDERFYINKVTSNSEIKSNFVFSDKISPLYEFDKILWYQEQPVRTPTIALIWNLCKKMREKNIRVVLGGEGGDVVTSHGQNYFKDLAVSGKWKKLLSELYSYSINTNQNLCGVFKNKLIFPLIPDYIKKKRLYDDNTSEITVLNKDFARKINAKEYWKNQYLKMKLESNTAKKTHYRLLTGLPLLMELERTYAAFSIEPRHPFYDKRLIEFCYGIPSEIKFKFGWSRYIQRIAMTDILPLGIQWRPGKANFSSYYKKNLLSFENNVLEDITSENNIINKYMNMETFKELYINYKHGKAGTKSVYLDMVGFSIIFMVFRFIKSRDLKRKYLNSLLMNDHRLILNHQLYEDHHL